MSKVFVTILTALSLAFTAHAQTATDTKEAEYTKVITERSAKIVSTLDLKNEKTKTQVIGDIADQYRQLNTIHDAYKKQVNEIKANASLSKESQEVELKKLYDQHTTQLDAQHTKYIATLSKKLSEEQIEAVKNGMTYGVLPITYRGYQQMLPELTEAQKKQILAYLTEARDHAMDAESSEKKHAWFGKYKGRINNYLSAQGIDMKKASKEWEARIAAEKTNASPK